MVSIYPGNMCVYFLELLLLKCNENAVLFFKITQDKVNGLFFLEKCPFCNIVFGGCPYFLNKVLDKVCGNQYRSCNPTNRTKYITLFSTP